MKRNTNKLDRNSIAGRTPMKSENRENWYLKLVITYSLV